ncbi:MAG: T9SS type A sorting domain-containing protein, partial [Bacteroidota bacterium]|nr:T9SS type A sorting domain-containing protein [Bacteroidota bacterium]
FDTSALKLQGVRTDGFLADGVAASAAMTATGARISLTGTARLSGSGTLMMLEFTGGNVPASTVVSVAVSDFQQPRGCVDATLAAANVTVIPKRASITTSAAPVIFTWDNTTKRYDPDPGVINVVVTNNGDLPLTGLSATLEETPEIRMAYNGSRTVAVSPLTLEPGKNGTATFFVQALPQETEITAQVDAVVTSFEGATATQRLYLNIKPAGSAYRVSCEADVITISNGNYTPDPAEVRATVTSAGTTDSPAGDVTILLPPELTLSGGNATQGFAAMAPGREQVLTWPVEYPTPAVKTDYEIMFVTASAGYADDTCRTMLTVPVLTAAQLTQSCRIVPAVIDSTARFDPFAVETTVRNEGNGDAYGVAAEITWPADFSLRTGETASKTLADTLAPGDSATVSWTIKRIANPDGCSDEEFDVDIRLATNDGPSGSCTASGTLLYPVNLLPEITQVTPAVLDTTDKDAEVQFSVRAVDREQAHLTYRWYVDGSEEGSRESLAWTFDAVGDVEVKVEIYDPCTLASNTPVVHRWNFHVRDLTGIADDPAALADFAITGNYPNPFNPGTVIEYRLPAGRHQVRLDVIDAYGRVVRRLLDEEQTGGSYRRAFDAAGLPSGTYIARLTTGGVARMHRMVLVR